jgi:hypothetical protein
VVNSNCMPAFQLYQNEAYRRLADKVGTQKLYILSAGWGLIGAMFLTPSYDITFTAQAEPSGGGRAITEADVRFAPKSMPVIRAAK